MEIRKATNGRARGRWSKVLRSPISWRAKQNEGSDRGDQEIDQLASQAAGFITQSGFATARFNQFFLNPFHHDSSRSHFPSRFSFWALRFRIIPNERIRIGIAEYGRHSTKDRSTPCTLLIPGLITGKKATTSVNAPVRARTAASISHLSDSFMNEPRLLQVAIQLNEFPTPRVHHAGRVGIGTNQNQCGE